MERRYYVYIMTNKENGVLYTGVTNDLLRRVLEHRRGLSDGFTKKYCCHKLVYYEACEEIEVALNREKQIKAGKRKKKEDLIYGMNPFWMDLADSIGIQDNV